MSAACNNDRLAVTSGGIAIRRVRSKTPPAIARAPGRRLAPNFAHSRSRWCRRGPGARLYPRPGSCLKNLATWKNAGSGHWASPNAAQQPGAHAAAAAAPQRPSVRSVPAVHPRQPSRACRAISGHNGIRRDRSTTPPAIARANESHSGSCSVPRLPRPG